MRYPSLILCALALPSIAASQNNRTLVLSAPAVVGQATAFTLFHPAAVAGNTYLFLGTLPQYPTVQSIVIPGLTVNGLFRLDPLNFQVLSTGLLSAAGTATHGFTVPNNAAMGGLTFDVQTVDLALATSTLTFSDNELSLQVSSAVPTNMVPIAPGTFQMGSPVTPLNVAPYFNQAASQPVHLVTITRPFWIGRFEVTQAEYQAVMGTNPSGFLGPQRPVDTVNWNNAMAYCAALTTIESAAGRVPTGYEYRLPTEAEWEYCCRAGTTTEYWCGPTVVCAQANFEFNQHTGSTCSIAQTVNVGSYAPNAWGLYDTIGNAYEWCLDMWDGSPNYPAGAVSDPYVNNLLFPWRMLRGGSWFTNSNYIRSAYRVLDSATNAYDDSGFRVVLAPILL